MQSKSAKTLIFHAFFVYFLSISSASAWTTQGKWSTSTLQCQNKLIKIGVDMKSRIGGSEISPVRDAFITINKVYFPAIWMVGADGNTLITKDSQYRLVFHKKIILNQKRSNELNCSTAN